MSEDTQQIGTLLSRMTTEPGAQVKFTPEQVDAMIEVFIPRFVTGAPGMPADMQCSVDRQDDGWVIRVKKPR